MTNARFLAVIGIVLAIIFQVFCSNLVACDSLFERAGRNPSFAPINTNCQHRISRDDLRISGFVSAMGQTESNARA
jgi:hypothetical protein